MQSEAREKHAIRHYLPLLGVLPRSPLAVAEAERLHLRRARVALQAAREAAERAEPQRPEKAQARVALRAESRARQLAAAAAAPVTVQAKAAATAWAARRAVPTTARPAPPKDGAMCASTAAASWTAWSRPPRSRASSTRAPTWAAPTAGTASRRCGFRCSTGCRRTMWGSTALRAWRSIPAIQGVCI